MAQMALGYSTVSGCSACAVCAPGGGAVSIRASVGQGGHNYPDDVREIQRALNSISPANGGPALALTVDGLVGPRTLAAIANFQQRHLGWADRRIDPGGPTLEALNASAASPAFKATGAPAIPPAASDQQNKEFMSRIGDRLPTAARWVAQCRFALDMAIDFNSDNSGSLFPSRGQSQYSLLLNFFKIDGLSRPQRIAYMQDLKSVFFNMQVVISQSIIHVKGGYGSGFFQPDPGDGTPASTKYDAFTFYGGWVARNAKSDLPRMSKEDNYQGPNLREDTIFFPVSHYAGTSDLYVTRVIIHELAHFVGPDVKSSARIGDQAYVSDGAKFEHLNAHLAKRNADSYSMYAATVDLNQT